MKDDDDKDNVTSITDFVNKSDNGKHKNWEWQRILNLLKDSGPENDEDNKEYAVRRIILDFLQAMTDNASEYGLSVDEYMQELEKAGLLPLMPEEDDD
tara:strand:- start:1913 stop:2206 length:294 start_codon:yes stop_codon:yes gene_type:complete